MQQKEIINKKIFTTQSTQKKLRIKNVDFAWYVPFKFYHVYFYLPQVIMLI